MPLPAVPAHHNLDEHLAAYLSAAGIADDKKGPLVRTAMRKTNVLTTKPMAQVDVYRMIKRRAKVGGIKTEIGCHTFRATGITAYLQNGGRLEVAQQMAADESARTTRLMIGEGMRFLWMRWSGSRAQLFAMPDRIKLVAECQRCFAKCRVDAAAMSKCMNEIKGQANAGERAEIVPLRTTELASRAAFVLSENRLSRAIARWVRRQ